MAVECGGAAACDREQDLLMSPGEPAATAFHKGRTSTGISHLQPGPVYALRGLR
jgi:hypothetical protein